MEWLQDLGMGGCGDGWGGGVFINLLNTFLAQIL